MTALLQLVRSKQGSQLPPELGHIFSPTKPGERRRRAARRRREPEE